MENQMNLFGDPSRTGPRRGGADTLAVARQAVDAGLAELNGVLCPCCGQRCAMRPRTITGNMCIFLIDVVRYSEIDLCECNGWVHYSKCRFTGRDYNFLKDHGLAITARSSDGIKPFTGYWRPTELGVQFVRREVAVHKTVWVFNNSVLKRSAQRIYIDEALGNSFSYEEIMGGANGE